MKILAGNWKMFKTRVETRAFFAAVGTNLKDSSVRKIVAASPTLLETALAASVGTGFEVFAQNAAWADSGAFTGETSPAQLLDIGVKGTILGHSERRQYFGETDASTVKRAQACLAKGLTVIYCLGERLEDRQAGRTEAVLDAQLKPLISDILLGMSAADLKAQKLMIAYEPVWAIGTGLTATTEQIKDAHAFLAKQLKAAGGAMATQLPALLYGGSVKPDNMGAIAAVAHVDGGLVGGASLEPESYLRLHEALDKTT